MRITLSSKSIYRLFVSFAIILSIFTYGCVTTTQTPPAEPAPEPVVQKLSPVDKLVDIKNNSSDFKITIWTERGRDHYTIGEEVVYMISTNRDSYVTLFNIGTSGNIYQIYPNQYQRLNFCRAGIPVRIPGPNADFAFQLQGPTGFETVKAFATLKDVPHLSPNLSKPVGPVRQTTVPEYQIARDIITKLNNLPINFWAEDEYEIYVGY